MPTIFRRTLEVAVPTGGFVPVTVGIGPGPGRGPHPYPGASRWLLRLTSLLALVVGTSLTVASSRRRTG